MPSSNKIWWSNESIMVLMGYPEHFHCILATPLARPRRAVEAVCPVKLAAFRPQTCQRFALGSSAAQNRLEKPKVRRLRKLEVQAKQKIMWSWMIILACFYGSSASSEPKKIVRSDFSYPSESDVSITKRKTQPKSKLATSSEWKKKKQQAAS